MQLMIAILVFLAVMTIGGAILAARAARRKPVEERLRELQATGGREQAPADRAKPGLVGVLTYLGSHATLSKSSAGLQEELARAGFHGPNAAAIYLGAKILMLAVGLIVLALLLAATGLSAAHKVLLTAIGAVSLSFVPNMVVYTRRKKRTEEIRHHLPDALDLLEICVSAGMGVDMAWNAVADEVRHVSPTLADEMALANLEIHLGAPRAVALRHMAYRTGGEDLSSLVAILVQSERFGTSIADGLQTFASSLREIRSQRAQEVAEKMAVKLILPMAVCIFPVVLVVLVGPAAIELFHMLARQ